MRLNNFSFVRTSLLEEYDRPYYGGWYNCITGQSLDIPDYHVSHTELAIKNFPEVLKLGLGSDGIYQYMFDHDWMKVGVDYYSHNAIVILIKDPKTNFRFIKRLLKSKADLILFKTISIGDDHDRLYWTGTFNDLERLSQLP